jgi:hypothetical protein
MCCGKGCERSSRRGDVCELSSEGLRRLLTYSSACEAVVFVCVTRSAKVRYGTLLQREEGVRAVPGEEGDERRPAGEVEWRRHARAGARTYGNELAE